MRPLFIIRYSIFALLYSLFFILYSPIAASGITVSPVYQYLDVDSTNVISPASVELTNATAGSLQFRFSLAHIQATDLLGRLQFNAPLPQTVIPADTGIAKINPNELSLNPGETATVSVTFNPQKIEPGKTAYLFLAELLNPVSETNRSVQTAVNQYLGSAIIIRDPTTTIPKLELRDLNWGAFPVRFSLPDFFRVQIKNSGTAFTVPRGLIQVTDLLNRELMRGPVNEQSTGILPNGERIIYARLIPSERSYPVALCDVKLVAYDDQRASTFTANRRFLYISPWFLLGITLLLLVPGLLKVVNRYRLKNR